VTIYEIFARVIPTLRENRERVSRIYLLLFNLNYFASLVLAAVGTGPVGAYFFMTIRAFGKLGCFQRIVRAAGGSAALRVSTFGIWHASIFSLKNIL